jgi:hypothetical protein
MKMNYVIMYEGEYGIKTSYHHWESDSNPFRYLKIIAEKICEKLNKTANVKYFAAHESILDIK